MTRINYRKTLTVMITLAMIFSALAIISFAAQPAYAASGNFTVDPTTFTVGTSGGVSTIGFASGGTFGAGSTVYFFLSTTQSSSQIVSGSGTSISGVSNTIGSVTLNANQNTLNNQVTFTMYSGAVAGTYYILAEDYISGNPSGTYALGPQVTIVTPAPTVSISSTTPSPFNVGQTVKVSGTGFDQGASITLYLNYPGNSSVLGTATANSAGTFKTSFTLPAMSGTEDTSGNTLESAKYIVAQETNSLSPTTFPEGGITASVSFNVEPTVTVSPMSTQGAAGSSFTITGNGFVAGQVFAGFSSSSGGGPSSIHLAQSSFTDNLYYSTVTVSSNGYFQVTATLASSLKSESFSVGPISVVAVATTPAATDTFSDALYYSIPGQGPHLTLIDESLSTPASTDSGTVTGHVGDTLAVIVYSFPASSTVNVYFDSVLMTFTTDSNGFADYMTVVPNVPGGTYYPFAVSAGITATVVHSFIVSTTATVTDSSGTPLYKSGTYEEYAASGSAVTVSLVGYSPYQVFWVTDSGLPHYSGNLSKNDYNGYVAVTVLNGSFNSQTLGFVANGQGNLTLTYDLGYKAATATTKTNESISVVTGVTTVTTSYYYEVGPASVTITGSVTGTLTSSGPYSLAPGETVTLSVSNLIPAGATVTPETAGWIGPYSVYMNGAVVTLTSGKNTFLSTSTQPTTAQSVDFVLSTSMASGVYNLSVIAESGTGKAVYNNPEFIVSTPSSSSGTVTVSMVDSTLVGGTGTLADPFTGYPSVSSSNNVPYAIEFDLYGFKASQSVTVTYYTTSGTQPKTGSVTTDLNGGATYSFTFPASVGNVPYGITFSYTVGTTPATITGATWYYENVPAVSLDQSSFNDNGGVPATDYYSYNGMDATPASTITVYANSLLPQTSYNIYISASPSFTSADYQQTFITGSNGDATVSVTLPSYVTNSTIYLDVAPSSSSLKTTTLFITVEVSQLVPTQAFPGEILSFSWEASTMPMPVGTSLTAAQLFSLGLGGTAGGYAGPILTTVYLNQSAYVTVDGYIGMVAGTEYLNGSFLAPNAAPGSNWVVSLSWTQTIYAFFTSAGSPTGSMQKVISHTGAQEAYLSLVQGNGALLTGISSSEVATIVAAVSGAVTTTMKVPLSELAANITALHGTIVQITTAFGNMTTTLSAIKANVTAVVSGEALLSTELGQMKTSLASLNATIVSLNGTTATLATNLGTVKTSLSGINATVTSINNGVATVQTSLGALTGTVTAMNGTVATISTNVGTIQTTVGQVKTYTSGFSTLEIFLIVAIVLILITLVIAFLAVSSSNKVARKIEEQKKQ